MRSVMKIYCQRLAIRTNYFQTKAARTVEEYQGQLQQQEIRSHGLGEILPEDAHPNKLVPVEQWRTIRMDAASGGPPG
jgi:hypothetical protein